MERPASNIAALDGLRGIAIILVLGRHAIRPFYSGDGFAKIAGWDVATPLINGWIGVDLFFLLSGFLITHQMLRRRERGSPSSLRDYFSRRFFRIAPTYLVVLALVIFGLIPFYRPDVSVIQVVRHVLVLQDYGGSGLVAAFWSLGVEEKFYLLAPLLFAALLALKRNGSRMLLLLALVLLSLALRNLTYFAHPEIQTYEQAFPVLRSPFHLNLDALMAGVALAIVYDSVRLGTFRISKSIAKAGFGCGSVCVVALLFAAPLEDKPTWFNATILTTLLSAAFGSIAFGLLFQPKILAPLFESRALFFAARISYPLYLIHMTLIPATLSLVATIPGAPGLSTPVRFLLFLPPFLALSVAAAVLLHVAVERPGLALRERLISRRSRSQTPVPLPVTDAA